MMKLTESEIKLLRKYNPRRLWELQNEDYANIRVVRHVDRPVLGPEEEDFVPLPITDDRNENPDYAIWEGI